MAWKHMHGKPSTGEILVEYDNPHFDGRCIVNVAASKVDFDEHAYYFERQRLFPYFLEMPPVLRQPRRIIDGTPEFPDEQQGG